MVCIGGQVYSPYIWIVLITSVKILPYRAPACLINTNQCKLKSIAIIVINENRGTWQLWVWFLRMDSGINCYIMSRIKWFLFHYSGTEERRSKLLKVWNLDFHDLLVGFIFILRGSEIPFPIFSREQLCISKCWICCNLCSLDMSFLLG